jgi:hypothetical protein
MVDRAFLMLRVLASSPALSSKGGEGEKLEILGSSSLSSFGGEGRGEEADTRST